MSRHLNSRFFLSLVVRLTIAASAESTEQPTVSLKDGTDIVGVYEEYHNDELPAHGKVESFYGIPYAKPPVGPLRFKPPVPRGKLESPFDAVQVGSSCIQIDPNVTGLMLTNEHMSEDCLFLDVIVPYPRPEKAPVLFAIHGGSYMLGSGNMPYATALPSVVYGGIIVVTINYRLNVFGFSHTGDGVIPGNIGLLDQQLALKWVNENIEERSKDGLHQCLSCDEYLVYCTGEGNCCKRSTFGGDPSSITIQGVSAGASSVGFHVLSPGSRGLFKNGIMESGSPVDPWNGYRSPDVTKAEAEALAKLLGCSDDDIASDLLECLQRGSGEDLYEHFSTKLQDPTKITTGPVIDGTFLPDTPSAIIKSGKLNGENLIVGTNAEEGTLFCMASFPDKEVTPVVNLTVLGDLVTFLGGNRDPIILDLIKTLYATDPASLIDDTGEDDYFHEAAQFLGDKFFLCPESDFARRMAQSMDVYRYTMTYVPSHNFMDIKWAGAAHGDEVQYVSGAVFDEGRDVREEEKDLARLGMNYWLNFVKSGNPNTKSGATNDVTLPEWRKFIKGDEIFKDLTPEMGDRYMKTRECYFHDNILPGLADALDELKKLKEEDDSYSKWTKEGQCEGQSCHQEKRRDEGP